MPAAPPVRQAIAWVEAGALEPGQRVRHPSQPDWGTGQVQSVIGHRATVNFEHAGKVLVNTAVIRLLVAQE